LELHLLFAALAVAAGAFVQTTVGFGLAIVAAPILFYLDPHYVPAPITIAALVNCVFTSIYYRAHLSMNVLWVAMLARIPGSIAGAYLLLVISEQQLALLMAAIICFGMWINYHRLPVAANARNLGIAGFLSGVMGTSTSIGGPPMAVLMQGRQANAIRGNLAAFFIFSCIVSLLAQAAAGYLGAQQWRLGGALVPAAFVGSWLGVRYGQRVNERAMRILTLLFCGASVAVMLVQHVF
jgi:uncharacterized protein